MSETKQEGKVGLFREKPLEAMDSPESLNDYLRVTSPKVWLVLAAVAALLVGMILWGIFGRIHSTAKVAVEIGETKVCYVPVDQADKVLGRGTVEVQGREYPLQVTEDYDFMKMLDDMVQLGADTGDQLLLSGGLHIGDWVLKVPVTIDLPQGVYTGEVVTEDLQPISLLLQ